MAGNESIIRRRRAGYAAVGFGVLTGLSACSGGSDGSVSPFEPPPPLAGAARFGAGFAAAFAKSPNSDPVDPLPSDIIALSFTTDPFEVP